MLWLGEGELFSCTDNLGQEGRSSRQGKARQEASRGGHLEMHSKEMSWNRRREGFQGCAASQTPSEGTASFFQTSQCKEPACWLLLGLPGALPSCSGRTFCFLWSKAMQTMPGRAYLVAGPPLGAALGTEAQGESRLFHLWGLVQEALC